LLSFVSATSTADALKWALIAVLLSVLPVFLWIFYLVRTGKVDAFFTNIRKQRTKIYLLAALCAGVSCAILALLGAPTVLVAAFGTGILTILVFMCINLWWKISLHTALVAASVTVLVMLYGGMATATVALVPLTAWSRIELKRHSLAQATIGAILATLIVVFVFYPVALA